MWRLFFFVFVFLEDHIQFVSCICLFVCRLWLVFFYSTCEIYTLYALFFFVLFCLFFASAQNKYLLCWFLFVTFFFSLVFFFVHFSIFNPFKLLRIDTLYIFHWSSHYLWFFFISFRWHFCVIHWLEIPRFHSLLAWVI